ncbi:MAG: hypothetical protein LUE65_09460 [Clostridiales bacterium]|nr:hypothetical protein [Clostridiales bacterium]
MKMTAGRRFLRILVPGAMALTLTVFGTKPEADAAVDGEASEVESGTLSVDESSTESFAVMSADEVIESVETIGFVDTDGAKLSAIAVKYGVDLTGADVRADQFEIHNFGLDTGDAGCELGGSPGVPWTAYVNDTPTISSEGGSGEGNYVIIEVNTDYQLSRAAKSYRLAMYADVKQTGTIRTALYEITPGSESVGNYTVTEVITPNPQTGGMRDPEYYNYANDGTFTIRGIEGYEIHTIEGTNGLAALHVTDCFDEANGQYWDFDLPYALYVPADYDSLKQYALVLHIHDAGFMGEDPMITLTEAQGPSNFVSAAVQQMAKDQGLGGVIVVAPMISETYYMNAENPSYNLRSTRDNWSLSAAVPATWQLMDTITSKYNIDRNRIYGTGQSMGGMQVLEMAAQRDNYFAGILAISCKWGTNYNKELEYDGSIYYPTPADGNLVWTTDSDGSPCDYQNWYYLVSDDNILFENTMGEYLEIDYLYHDLAGVTLPSASMDPTSISLDEQNAVLTGLVSQDNATGIYKLQFGGSVAHMSAWFYGHNIDAGYQWLFSQTRESEMNRQKLALDRPFEAAAQQNQSEERRIADGVYYITGELGAGTEGYNSALYRANGDLYLAPGWTVDRQ